MMSNQQLKYVKFCESAPDLPVFMQPWFLDAVCQNSGAWDAVFVEKGKKTVGVLPYFSKKKFIWSYVSMPPLCKMMGPYLLPEFRNPKDENGFLKKLVAGLPSGLAGFEQDCNYHFQNWLPFFWKGFRQTTRYSYSLEINDLNQVYENFSSNYKNQRIPRGTAATDLKIVFPDEISGKNLEEFYRVQQLSYSRQNLPMPISFDFLEKFDDVLQAEKSRAIFFAKDKMTGQTHSVVYLIWDKTTAWFLLAGDDPALRNSGAGIFLVWECLKFTHNTLKIKHFDFAGSMIEPIEKVRRQFGAVQKPYFRVAREWNLLWKWGKAILR